MAISKYDKKFEYGKILTEGDLNGMVDAINLSIDGVNNADAKSEAAIKEATTAKNAVKKLEGLANSTEAMETLAGQVVQIEENKNTGEKNTNEIFKIKKQKEFFTPYINITPDYSWESGYYNSDGNINSENNHTEIAIPSEAKLLRTNARSIGTVKCVFFAGDELLSTFNNDNNNPKTITIPDGATKVGISNFTKSNPLKDVYIIFNPEELTESIRSVECNTYTYKIKDGIVPTYTSASGNRSYTFNVGGFDALYFTRCVFTEKNGVKNGVFTFYDGGDNVLGSITYSETFEGYLPMPSGCKYCVLTCFYTSNIGYCFLATKNTDTTANLIAQNKHEINGISAIIEPLTKGSCILDDGAYYNFGDKGVGENVSGNPYDLGKGTLTAGGMPDIIIQEGGYIGGHNLGNNFYITLKMRKNCAYISSTIIGRGDSEKYDGVLIISDELSRDGVTTQFHRRIVHVLLPNLNILNSCTIQLGDYDAVAAGKERWNYNYSEKTIECLYSNNKTRPVEGVKLLWELFIEDDLLYIFLDRELVEVYRNVSSQNENVANFAFDDLIPNANIGEVENCKVVDFTIGRRRFTYDNMVGLYNAKKYLL